MNARTDGLPKQRTKLYRGKCLQCGVEVVRTRSDGRTDICKPCNMKAASKRRLQSGKQAQWQRENREKLRVNANRWASNNRAYRAAAWAEYYAAKLKRIPPWANLDEVKEVYRQCRGISQMTGVPHHVDHIIPMRGDLVSGLHVASNLRIIPADENMRKNRRFDPAQYTAAV